MSSPEAVSGGALTGFVQPDCKGKVPGLMLAVGLVSGAAERGKRHLVEPGVRLLRASNPGMPPQIRSAVSIRSRVVTPPKR